jgi:hypothetical protein
MIKHADAFAPFSKGPYNCIGANRECEAVGLISDDMLICTSCPYGASHSDNPASHEI